MENLFTALRQLHPWLYSLATAILTVSIALAALWALWGLLARWMRHRGGDPAQLALHYLFRPLQLVIPALLLLGAVPTLPLPRVHWGPAAHAVGVLLIAGLTWLAVASLRMLEELLGRRFRLVEGDNLSVRRAQTQFQMLRQVLSVAIVIIGAGCALMTLPTLRQVGAGLFASAGVAGLVVGMAARPTLASLIAGVQVALTQPIRLDDVVIVQNEWGRVEEIHTTYVVLRTWDLRRLIVPLTQFIEQPFQNWTRRSAELLGHLYFYTDYNLRLDELRENLAEILKSTPLWNGKEGKLEITDLTKDTVQLRVVWSAADSDRLWALGCYIRERIVARLQAQNAGQKAA